MSASLPKNGWCSSSTHNHSKLYGGGGYHAFHSGKNSVVRHPGPNEKNFQSLHISERLVKRLYHIRKHTSKRYCTHLCSFTRNDK